VNVGDAVSSILILGSQATPIMTLGDVSEVYVQGKVDEADIGKVYLNQPARIVVESFKDKKFEGKVTKISPQGKEKDNVTTFEVRVSISNFSGELKANMSANAEILLEERKRIDGTRRRDDLRQGPQGPGRNSRRQGSERQEEGRRKARNLQRREN